MIDLHAHILPGVDDGPQTLEESLEMARQAVADGITVMVATPHLFRRKSVERGAWNQPADLRLGVEILNRHLADEGLGLKVLPGCEVPLFPEILEFLKQGRLLTLNDGGRYLCLELPDTVIPPATEDIVFQLSSQGITPILSHPERNPIFYQNPARLKRLISLGCLSQITARSLTGGFGWGVGRFTKKLLRQGLVHVMATDAHSAKHRPPILSTAFRKLEKIVGESRAWDMVATFPERILRGDPWL
uniref:protein-tyrosine-phosphatase n=1 Tax=Desulfobacca acetoxidans TaxID=60893 RepID=A0A7C5ELG0_9BACT